MARGIHTLLLLTSARVVRADFGGAPGVVPAGLWTQAATADGGLLPLAAQALALGPACGRHVWILAEGIWTQKLSLSQQATDGLSTEELAKALSFEVEPISGIPADQSALGVAKAISEGAGGEGQDYWIVQMPENVVAGLADLVRRAGGKLSAIGHPGGLGALIRPTVASGKPDEKEGVERWRRIEVWQQATLLVTGGGAQPAGLHVVNNSPDHPSWQRSVQRWLTATDASCSEWLGNPDPKHYLPAEALPEQWIRLELGGKADIGTFLHTWMRRLALEISDAPLIRPQPKKAGRREFVLAGVMLEIAALLLIGAHAGGLTWYQRRETVRLHEAQSQSRQLADLKDQIAKADSQLAELDPTRSADGRSSLPVESAIAGLRKRLFHAVTGLGAARPSGLVLRQITAKGSGELMVQGVALEPDLPDRYAVTLTQYLRGDGMVVTPAVKTAQGWADDGGPWSFSITLDLQGAPGPGTKPAIPMRSDASAVQAGGHH